jgi:hypothetical protein
MVITPVLQTAEQQFPRYFHEYLAYFMVLQKFYTLILQSLMEPLTTMFGRTLQFYGTMLKKRCSRVKTG